jgi:hypothetical protein
MARWRGGASHSRISRREKSSASEIARREARPKLVGASSEDSEIRADDPRDQSDRGIERELEARGDGSLVGHISGMISRALADVRARARNVRETYEARVSATIARADNTIARHSAAFKSAAVNYTGYDYRRVSSSPPPRPWNAAASAFRVASRAKIMPAYQIRR